jgi:DNA-binding transcriptional regulator YdaS (Cro superfamily)
MEKLLEYFGGKRCEMAKQLGVSNAHVSLCLSGQRKFSPALTKKASKLTGVAKKYIRPDIYG